MAEAFNIEINNLKASTRILRALTHTIRQFLIKEIHKASKINVTSLYTNLGIEQSAASQQLAILLNAGFVHTERKGREIYYSLNNNRFAAINKLLKTLGN